MKTLQKIATVIVLFTLLSSCSTLKNNSVKESRIDPVCGMTVDKSDAYHYKYEGKKYYFDKYECKQTFIMNPKKFIDNKIMEKQK